MTSLLSSQLIHVPLWTWGIGSWCMCFYVMFASCEGARWFRIRKNPLLILGAVGSVTAIAAGVSPPYGSIALTCCGWTLYSVLVSVQYLRFRQWRHVIPVNIPVGALLAWCWLRE